MRFGLIHKILTSLLATFGVLAIASTGALPGLTNAVLATGIVLATLVPERWGTESKLRHLATVAPVMLVLIQGARLFLGQHPLDVAIEFAAALQIVRVATRRGAAHDAQIIMLALLHLVSGTVLGGGLSYALCFIGFLVLTPPTLMLSHLRREVEGNYRQGARDRTGLPVDVPRILRSRRVVGSRFLAVTAMLSLPILLFTLVLFLLFPRVGLSFVLMSTARSGRMVGFSDHVDLGAVGVLRSDPTLALRFRVPDLPEPAPATLILRLRGTAFDTYDGRTWSRSTQDLRTNVAIRPGTTLPISPHGDPRADRSIEIDLEPLDPSVVFLPTGTTALRVRPMAKSLLSEPLVLQRGPEGELRYSGSETRGLRYEVFVNPSGTTGREVLSEADRTRYLSLPPAATPRLRALAERWTEGLHTAQEKAQAIEHRLKTEFRYDLASTSGGTENPLDHFLFESQRGHCEFFSTAMAIMLRAVGVPSRNVTGFVGGTYNRFGKYFAVREGEAHSWLEAHVETPYPHWATFDPTPSSGAQPLQRTDGALIYARDVIEALSQRWNQYVIGYDIYTQIRMLESLRSNYAATRKRVGINRYPKLDKYTRAPILVAGAIGLAIATYVFVRRRGQQEVTKTRLTAAPDRRSVVAIDLYRRLERALSAHGMVRADDLPPLRFAHRLVETAHPLATDVLQVTQWYLDLRFGHIPLSSEAKAEIEGRIESIARHPPLGG